MSTEEQLIQRGHTLRAKELKLETAAEKTFELLHRQTNERTVAALDLGAVCVELRDSYNWTQQEMGDEFKAPDPKTGEIKPMSKMSVSRRMRAEQMLGEQVRQEIADGGVWGWIDVVEVLASNKDEAEEEAAAADTDEEEAEEEEGVEDDEDEAEAEVMAGIKQTADRLRKQDEAASESIDAIIDKATPAHVNLVQSRKSLETSLGSMKRYLSFLKKNATFIDGDVGTLVFDYAKHARADITAMSQLLEKHLDLIQQCEDQATVAVNIPDDLSELDS